MRAFMLDGSNAGDEGTKNVREALVTMLRGAGWEVDARVAREMDIAPCNGCFNCWVRTPGVCIHDDEGRDIVRELARADMLVLVSPLSFGGFSSTMKLALDRILPILLPFFINVNGELHHPTRYENHPMMLVVGTMARRDPREEAILRKLIGRIAINMHSPAQAVGVLDGAVDAQRAAALSRTLLGELGVSV